MSASEWDGKGTAHHSIKGTAVEVFASLAAAALAAVGAVNAVARVRATEVAGWQRREALGVVQSRGASARQSTEYATQRSTVFQSVPENVQGFLNFERRAGDGLNLGFALSEVERGLA